MATNSKQLDVFKVFIVVASVTILSSCVAKQEINDDRLEGTWISDKQKTLSALDKTEGVSKEMREFLERHLGEIGVVFKVRRTALIDVTDHLTDPRFYKFSVTASDKNSISIETRGVRATYYFEGNCFYLKDEHIKNYIEYFCKH